MIPAPFPAVFVGGVPFQATTMARTCEWLLDRARSDFPEGVNLRLANAYNVALANSVDAYGELLIDQGLNFPDGTPVTWFMRTQRRYRAERVRGPSLFALAMRESVARGTRHFLLGGAPETLVALRSNLMSALPGIVISGSYSPPFAPITDAYVDDCAKQIRDCAPDIVWVGLGTPKQDYLGTALARELGAVTVNVGAAFDFMAGTVREAPAWVQRSGFEWFYRLLAEPKRLWKRYLVGNAQFLAVASIRLIQDRRKEANKT